MYPLPGPADEDESGSSGSESEVAVGLEELWTWYVRAIILGSMAVTAYKFLMDPDIRLHAFRGLARMFGQIARVFGNMALVSEKAYYEVVDSIPH